VAQTDGEPLPEPSDASGDPGTKTEALRATILERIAIEQADDLGGALGTGNDRTHPDLEWPVTGRDVRGSRPRVRTFMLSSRLCRVRRTASAHSHQFAQVAAETGERTTVHADRRKLLDHSTGFWSSGRRPEQ
jgi:hypothetical protein